MEGALDVTVIVVENGQSDPSSNCERGCFYFALW